MMPSSRSTQQIVHIALEQGVDFSTYLEQVHRRLEATVRKDAGTRDSEQLEFIRLNYQRMKRNQKLYQPGERVQHLIKGIEKDQLWLVLTEDWCGDSAHVLPFLARLAELNSCVRLRILHRDEHPDIMECYLTEGKRSIPKWIVLDFEGRELFRWGPRPAPAAQLFQRLKTEGLEKQQISFELQRWYNADRGKSLEQEVVQWLEQYLRKAA